MAASLVGLAGIIANIFIYQQKNRDRLLLNKLIADVIWLIHYRILGAYSGAAICAVGIIREIIFLNNRRKWARSKLWLLFFILLGIISAVLTWENAFSILPALASVLAIISFWIGNPKTTRLLQIPISSALLVYNVICLSYTGIINEILSFISIILAFIRFKTKTEKTEQ